MQCMFLFINWKRKDAFENSYYSRSHSKWTVDYLWLEQEDMISTAIATMLSLERSYIPYSGCFYIRSLLLSHKLLWYKRPYDLQSKISWYSNFKKFTGNFFSLQFLDSEVEAKFLCATTINCLHDFEKMGGFLKNFFVYLSISNCLHIHFIPSQNISSILFLFLYIYDIFSPNVGKCGKNADQNNSEYGHFLHSVHVWNIPNIASHKLMFLKFKLMFFYTFMTDLIEFTEQRLRII